MTESTNPNYTNPYRWVMLGLCALTPLLVFSLPNLSIPGLFERISVDLNLSVFQVGVVWGAMSFTGIFVGIIGGALGDRFGSRRVLAIACILTGIFGATRGLSTNFPTLLLTTLALGIAQPAIPVMIFVVARKWFPSENLGLAAGVISFGFAMGLTLGPLLGNSVLAPALGGWRNVLFVFGAVAVAVGVLWWVLHPPEDIEARRKTEPEQSILSNFMTVLRMRTLWLIGLGGFGIRACVFGMAGYLPTYLKDLGWESATADRALAAFFFASLLFVVPLATLSDRLRVRYGFLAVTATVITIGISSLVVVNAGWVFVAVVFAGMVFDSHMSILNTVVLEAAGGGGQYAGMALGLAGMFGAIGSTLSPPIGNSLVGIGANVPFAFWAGMGLISVLIFTYMSMETRNKLRMAAAMR